VVSTPLVQILSLIAIGIPARGGSISLFCINLSMFSACAIAFSFVVQIYELISESLESIFKKISFTSSFTEAFLLLISFLKELKSIFKLFLKIKDYQKVNGSSFLHLTKLCLIFLEPSSDRSLIKEEIFSFKLRLVIKGPNQ